MKVYKKAAPILTAEILGVIALHTVNEIINSKIVADGATYIGYSIIDE